MNLLPTQEQQEIIGVIREFFANEISVRRYQEPSNLGAEYPAGLWQQIVELGLFGIGVSEEAGGMGLTLSDEVLIAREVGRQVVSPSVLGTTLAIHLLADAGKTELCGALMAGTARATLALCSDMDVDGESLSGKLSVFDGAGVDYLIACDRERCFLVSAGDIADAVHQPCTDESVRLDNGVLNGVKPVAVSTDANARLRFALVLSAALAGISEAARDDAAAYAKEREQFGQAIGSFQAIAHMCADMATVSEGAWAQCVFASQEMVENYETAAFSVACAAVVSEKAAINNSRGNVQVHGGVGFTVEYDAHFFVKRTHIYRELVRNAVSSLDTVIPRQ